MAVETVLDAVREIVPVLRRNGEESEARRWVVEENLQLLDKAGVFRTATPRRFGGLDLSLADQARVLTEIARGCPSTGWVSFVWLTSNWTATLYPDRAQEEVFAAGSVRISSAFAPTGRLTSTADGYRLTGSWRYNSGVKGADWDFLAAVRDGDEHDEVMVLVPVSELSLADDWDVTSGGATGSVTVTAQDVFVPAHRAVGFGDAFAGTTGDRANTGATGRNYGVLAFIMAEAAAVFIGIAKGALELFLERVPGRGITYTNWTDQSQHPLTQVQVATAANKIAAAEALSGTWLELLQRRADAGEQPTDTEKAVIRGQVGFAVQLCREAVEVLYGASGGSVIQRNSPIQRFHRDIQGFSLHALAQPNVNLELQGRVLLGLDPGTYFL
ncbi:acyl-CoA dehydrogenase family protein [Saccharothrix variisporea]|uniref:Alkylation response protein AidB-like acyl-CoA dehydrogenase n=1 Tax=Saccharothrix variisporea TaxID=543527 RepID=A0A495XPI9_9PSEU|nr:acyl-CoA dehydrogenase family protein [Saccharothrix variisporea]RKT74814.1 alkylation response protein AidB-like acyl-CoA dehydrogenase [Saccharothrix variisporea]